MALSRMREDEERTDDERRNASNDA